MVSVGHMFDFPFIFFTAGLIGFEDFFVWIAPNLMPNLMALEMPPPDPTPDSALTLLAAVSPVGCSFLARDLLLT